jgi:hypothetical protein
MPHLNDLKGRTMPQFEIRCNTKRVLAVETAEHTDFSDWDSTDSPYSIRRLDVPAASPHVRELECGSHVLRIDMRLFRSQRELLTKVVDLARNGQPYSPGPEDGPLLEGLLELTDALFDAAAGDGTEVEGEVRELLKHARQVGEPEGSLDDLVHDTAQDVGLGDLNELDDPDEQESHIGSVEESTSEINNGGLEEQLRFLLKQCVSPERIRQELEATE